jgi:hypothetical protein
VTIVEVPTTRLPAADAPLPAYESYSSMSTYEACPRRYAFRYVERLPGEVSPGQFAFGNCLGPLPLGRRTRRGPGWSGHASGRRCPYPSDDPRAALRPRAAGSTCFSWGFEYRS